MFRFTMRSASPFRRKTSSVKPSSSPVLSSPFAYGVSNFEQVRMKNQFFVDNTRHIAVLEGQGTQFLFFRPPRFGKSLFVDVLHRYYDCATSETVFNDLFHDLHVHRHVTPLVRSFHVLKFDFDIATEGDVAQHFHDHVNRQIAKFRDRYNLPQIDLNVKNSHDSLESVEAAVKAAGGTLYVLVDEYDRFANRLLVESIGEYQKVIKGESGNVKSSVLRSFLGTLKKIGGAHAHFRSFITGIMPLALADAFGYNVAKDISHDVDFASLVGFRKADLERALALVPPLNTKQRQDALDLMRKFYNGYWFAGATEPLYNPTQSLFLLEQLALKKINIDQLLALDNIFLVDKVSDQNVKLSARFVTLARKVPDGARAVNGLLGDTTPLDRALMQTFTLEQLIKVPSVAAAQALLFYQGIATFTNATGTALRVPNEIIRQTQFAPLDKLIQFNEIDALLREPTVKIFDALFTEIAANCLADDIQNEATFEFHVGRVLSSICRPSDIRLQVPVKGMRTDLLLVRSKSNVALVLEVKHVPIEVLNSGQRPTDHSFTVAGRSLSDLSVDEMLLLPTTTQSSHMPEAVGSIPVRKVAHIVLGAQEQAAEQAAALMSSDKALKSHGLSKDAVVHAWVAVLVGNRVIVRSAANRVATDQRQERANDGDPTLPPSSDQSTSASTAAVEYSQPQAHASMRTKKMPPTRSSTVPTKPWHRANAS